MKKVMYLGFDFDGVIANCALLKQKYIKKIFNLEVALEECTRKKVTSLGITSEQYDKLLSCIYDTDVAYEIEEIDGAIETLKRLQKERHHVKIVTSRFFQFSGTMVTQWLGKRELNIPLICTNKTPKGPYCRGLDLFVDDEIEKLELIQPTVDNLFLFSTPYNTEDKGNRIIKRVNNWQELYAEIQKLKVGYDGLPR